MQKGDYIFMGIFMMMAMLIGFLYGYGVGFDKAVVNQKKINCEMKFLFTPEYLITGECLKFFKE